MGKENKNITTDELLSIALERGEKKSVTSQDYSLTSSADGKRYADFDSETLALDATLYKESSGGYKVIIILLDNTFEAYKFLR